MSSIQWRSWSAETFAEARATDKLVLLSITAPWCQFCRAMDEQTYSNDAIAEYINSNVIPVRVDSDKRPDINTRYSQGGWPSTCVLTPDGDMLWGGTFVPADGFAQLLPQVMNEFKNNKQGLANHVAQQREQLRQQNTPPDLNTALEPSLEVVGFASLNVKHFYDFAFAGFKLNNQKFPQVEALELALEQFTRSALYGYPDGDLHLIVARTLEAMAEGGLHDPIDGGFFRYTQNVDWGAPQPEKVLADNADLARLYLQAYQVFGEEGYKMVAEKTLAYMDKLYDASRGVWYGSQVASPEYFSEEQRGAVETDGVVYAGANAQAARAHFTHWQATGDDASLAKAARAVNFVLENLASENGALIHYLAPAGETAPVGLLADAVEVVAACVDLYEAGQGEVYLDAAEHIAKWCRTNLEDARAGGMFDALVQPGAVGNLQVGTKDVGDNMQMADALLRLFLLSGEEEHAQCAQRMLQAFQPAVQQLGFFAAKLALATERALLPPVILHILGKPGAPDTMALLKAAHKPFRHERVIIPLNPENENDAEYIEELGYEKPTQAIAYPHLATTPLPRTIDPETLTETVRAAGAPEGGMDENPAFAEGGLNIGEGLMPPAEDE